ncbi:MAG: FG-GAP-like repeat-containing protein [Candidatus Eisenbacteria bacterium]
MRAGRRAPRVGVVAVSLVLIASGALVGAARASGGATRLSFTPADRAGGAEPPVPLDAVSQSASWTQEGGQVGALFGVAVATAGDVNGDGYSDLVVGAQSYDNGEADEGRAYLYLGSATGAASAPVWTAEGNQVAGAFGGRVAPAGDVNGDGYDDVLVVATTYDNGESNEGKAYLYLGTSGGLAPTPSWTAEGNQADALLGQAAGTAGDVNGDGYADVIIGVRSWDNGEANEGRVLVYHGSASGLSATPAWSIESNQAGAELGYSAAGAGDVNGDGYADVIVAAYLYDNGETNEGKVWAYLGSSSGLSTTAAWSVESNQANAWLGGRVATAGDVDGDGYADVLIAARLYDNGETDEGKVWLYRGSSSGPLATSSWNAEGNQASASLGRWLDTCGDVNGDGYADVILGAYQFDNPEADEGRAWVYYGSGVGLSTDPAWIGESDQAGAQLGFSLGTAGDVNGDGYSDILVGAYGYDNGEADEGRAYVYDGAPDGLEATASWTLRGGVTNHRLGTSIACAGDVNGDGLADVIISAPSPSDPSQAAVVVLRGQPRVGLSFGALLMELWAPSSDGTFGNAVSSAGDVNGDGYSDVVVGDPDFTNGNSHEGAVFLWYGGPVAPDPNPPPDWTYESSQSNARLGQSVASAGDVNGDGFGDVIIGSSDRNRVWVFLGGPSGLSLEPNWTYQSPYEDDFGFCVAGIGDVNGDGYSDVAVGAPSFPNYSIQGRAVVFYGSSLGLSEDDLWDYWIGGRGSVGYSVAGAGDINADGYSDLIVGCPGLFASTPTPGRAYIWLGSATGLQSSPDIGLGSAEGMDTGLGYAVSSAGDVDGNGLSDILVGEPYHDTGTPGGGAHVWYSRPGELVGFPPDWTGTWGDAERLGQVVCSTGDVNGDGLSDILIDTADYDASPTSNCGLTIAFRGNLGKGLDRAPLQMRANLSAPVHLLGLPAPANFAVSVMARSPLGRARTKLEWEVKPLGTPLNGGSLQSSPTWTDTGAPQSGSGSAIRVNGTVAPPAGNQLHWRARTRTRSPYLPHGPWLSLSYNAPSEADIRMVSTSGVDDAAVTPDGVARSWPNPFRDTVRLRFAQASAGPVRLEVFDVTGRRVAIVADRWMSAGEQTLAWGGSDGSGRRVASGVYLLRLEAEGVVRTVETVRVE